MGRGALVIIIFGLMLGCSRTEEPREWLASDHEAIDPVPEVAAAPPPASMGGRTQPLPATDPPPDLSTIATDPSANTGAGPKPSASAVPHGGVAFTTWVKSCVPCHGRIGRGDGPEAAGLAMPDFSSPAFQSTRTDETLIHAVVAGTPRGMPAFTLAPEVVRELVLLARQMGGVNTPQAPIEP